MVYTKEEFKRLWEADIAGKAIDGITNDDCADCAKAWGIYSNPKCASLDEVVYRVCKAAGVREEDMPYNPFDMKRRPTLDDLKEGEYTIPDDCTAKIVGRTVVVYKRKSKKLAPNEYRCKDCKHRVKGRTFRRQYYDTMVCELKPKEENGLFYCAPLYGKPCKKFEKK